MRTPTACLHCKQAKRRCIRSKPAEPCTSCQFRRLICEGKRQSRLSGQRSIVPRSVPDLDACRQFPQHTERRVGKGPDLSRGTAIELVDHYLDKFHGRPHSIFHPASLRSQVRDGNVNTALLYAICAIGSKFSGNPDTRGQGPELAAESRRLLQADISNVCLENIQTCTLIAMLSVGRGNSASETLFFRIACAMAEIMKLDSPVPGGFVIDCEIRRRVWWSLYMTDMWCICGQGLQSHMKDIKPTIELPTSDSDFISLSTEQVSTAGPLRHGIWAQLVTLVPLFRPIHDINRHLANGEACTADLDQKVEKLAHKLEDWNQKLPNDAQMNPGNLDRQQKIGLGGLLISIHLAYHHYSTLLYFRYLGAKRPPSSIDQTYITRCKAHASAFSSLLRQSRQLKGCDVVYPNIGHMVTVSSSVLVHTLLFGEPGELETAREELNANFEALIDLTQYWPATSAMIERLIVFQDMCLLSMSTESGTHKLNGWMLKFLIEHSLDIEAEKVHLGPSSLDADYDTRSSKARELASQGRYMSFRSA